MNNYTDTSKWKFGAEHELADWDIRSELPSCVKRNLDDYSIVNSNGIANDPSGKITCLGGELNTTPTDTIEGQVEILRIIKKSLPNAKTNYHSNLHLHISIPGLSEDLETLKYIQKRIHEDMPLYLDKIDPLVCDPTMYPSAGKEDYKIIKKRINHSKVSRHKLLTSEKLNNQLNAKTLDDFFNAEPPISKAGKPLFHLAPRLCINLRSLRDNGTIEFRHWAGTMEEDKFRNAFLWCKEYLLNVLNHKSVTDFTDYDINEFFKWTLSLELPRQSLVNVNLEKSFNLTSVHKVGREIAMRNVEDMKF